MALFVKHSTVQVPWIMEGTELNSSGLLAQNAIESNKSKIECR